ncbi:hypothetical protein ES708_27717 [subsurface metagenome]
MFKANTKHPLFKNIHDLIFTHIGFDHIINKVINRLGDIKMVFITGDFAKGKDSKIIDLIFVGNTIDREYLVRQTERAEKIIKRKIRFLVYENDNYREAISNYKDSEILLLWNNEELSAKSK